MFWSTRTWEQESPKKESVSVDCDKDIAMYDGTYPVCMSFESKQGLVRVYLSEGQLESLITQGAYVLQEIDGTEDIEEEWDD